MSVPEQHEERHVNSEECDKLRMTTWPAVLAKVRRRRSSATRRECWSWFFKPMLQKIVDGFVQQLTDQVADLSTNSKHE